VPVPSRRRCQTSPLDAQHVAVAARSIKPTDVVDGVGIDHLDRPTVRITTRIDSPQFTTATTPPRPGRRSHPVEVAVVDHDLHLESRIMSLAEPDAGT
jgi:hypothetical protein